MHVFVHSAVCPQFATLYTNKMHTLRYNYSNVSVHINSYMFRASYAHHQLYNTIVRPYYYLQNVEWSEVHRCTIYRDGYVHSNWSSL
jgi:hypothetical protein